MGFNFGIMNGWSSPAIFVLTSNESPLPTGKITAEQASWIASLKSLGMVFGSLFIGFIVKKYGRKWPLMTLPIQAIVRHDLTLLGSN